MKIHLLEKASHAKIIYLKNRYLRADDLMKQEEFRWKLLETASLKCTGCIAKNEDEKLERIVKMATTNGNAGQKQQELLKVVRKDLAEINEWTREKYAQMDNPDSELRKQTDESRALRPRLWDKYDAPAFLSFALFELLRLVPTTAFIRGHVVDVLETTGLAAMLYMFSLRDKADSFAKKMFMNAVCALYAFAGASVLELAQYAHNAHKIYKYGTYDPWDFLSYAIGAALGYALGHRAEKKRRQAGTTSE